MYPILLLQIPEITQECEVFLNYSWPGNIRELENVASYYCILSAIPDYIYSTNNQLLAKNSAMLHPNLERNTLICDEQELKLRILRIIAESSDAFHGIGRSAMHKNLASQNLNVGEGKLRTILTELGRDGLIKVNMGRLGSQITQKGREYLRFP